MEYEKKYVRHVSHCLECGDRISYGRTDKKFCSEECKNRHHNHLAGRGRMVRRHVMAALERNYEVLDGLYRAGVESISVSDVLLMGFVPGYMTSHRKLRGREECCCFDIKYILTPSRLSSISKIQNVSLTLQTAKDREQ